MNKVKLGQILDVKRGASLSGEYYSEKGEKIRLTLGNFNYPGGGFKENTSKIDIFFNGEVKPEFILKKGDIITPLTEQVAGLLGETARIPEDDLYIQSGDIGLVIPDESKLDRSFTYYLISSPVVKKQLGAAAQQTKIRHTSPDKIKDCEVWIPELAQQKKIGKLLDSINSKIEVNNKINAELEAMAKTLYDYWFLQFEFPNEEGKPYKSSGGKMVWNEELKREIPEGWEVLKVSDITNVVTGKEDANFAVENGAYKFFTCSQDILLCDEYSFEGSAVLIAGNGDFNVKHYTGKFNAYQRTYVLIPKEKEFYGCLYIAAKEKIDYFKAGANGSIVKFIAKGDVEQITMLKPRNDNLFDTINKLIEQIEIIQKENEELTSLRDFLLPLLMNGQVGFKEK